MKVELDLQVAAGAEEVPTPGRFESWTGFCLDHLQESRSALTVRIVEPGEIRQLNRDYRDADKATNVLSFPFESVIGVEENYLGDVVICAKVVADEAEAQGKSLEAHWAHMVIHGILHLCGFDHITDREAGRMEALETRILTGLGFNNPYKDE